MNYTNLVPVIGTVLRIMSERDCCSHMMSLQTANGIVRDSSNRQQAAPCRDADCSIL